MKNDSKVLISLEKYFSDKSYSFGGPIPKCVLQSQDSLKFFEMSFEESIDYAHNLIKDALPSKKYKIHSVDWQVQYILPIIEECRELKIPKEHHGPLVILHTLYCKGYREKIYVYDVVA